MRKKETGTESRRERAQWRETRWDRVKNPRKFNFEAVSAGSAVYRRAGV
jgi:hypothetical protein